MWTPFFPHAIPTYGVLPYSMTRIESSLSCVVLFVLCRFCVLCAWGLVELEPDEYNCGLRYPTVSCFLTTPCRIAILLAHLLNENYDEEL